MSPDDFEVRVDLRGLDEAERIVDRKGAQAIRENALDLLGNAIEDAPVEEGTLRGSGAAHFETQRIATGADFGQAAPDATPAERVPTGEMTAAVTFNMVYAAAQHEGIDFVHPKGGKAKYLEDNVERDREQYLRHIARAMEEGL